MRGLSATQADHLPELWRLPWLLPLTVNGESLDKLGGFLLHRLRIGVSTMPIVELLRHDWTGGISTGMAWLVLMQVEWPLPPLRPAPED